MFTPLVSFNEETHKFEVNTEILKVNQNQASVSYISLVDLKPDEFKALSKMRRFVFDQKKVCGLFISEIFTHYQGKQIRYIYLPPLNNRLEEKYQDLFASICLTLSNVCVFGMSSKYTRMTRDTQNLTKTWCRSNFIILNSHGPELYRVKIQSQVNKMEISVKIKIEDDQICPQQLIDDLQMSHDQTGIVEKLSDILLENVSPKFLLNFEEIKNSFFVGIRMDEWLKQTSEEYNKLIVNEQKISKLQMTQLISQIQSFNIEQLNQNLQRYLPSLKTNIINSLQVLNQSLTLKYLKQYKYAKFPSTIQQEQFLAQKQQLFMNLNKNDIPIVYSSIVYSDQQILLTTNKILQLEQTIQNKDKQIKQLQCDKSSLQWQINNINKKNEILNEQNYNFREINKAYEQVCEQLNKQRQQTRKNRIQIQSLLIDQNNHVSNETRLEETINRLKNQLNAMKQLIHSLIQTKTDNQSEIVSLNGTISILQEQINRFSMLEAQALASIQKQIQNTKNMKQYKKFSDEFMDNWEQFKQMEKLKINFILARNYEKYKVAIKEKEEWKQKTNQKELEIEDLKAKFRESEITVEYCQQQIFEKICSEQPCDQQRELPTTTGSYPWRRYQSEEHKQHIIQLSQIRI